MKKLFAIISALMLTATAFAQEGNVGKFTIQPMVGVTSTTSLVFKYEGASTMKNETGLGFTIGADFGYRASELFYPTVGLHFVQSRTNVDMNGSDENITVNNVAVPVLANFNVSGLRLGVGVQPAFNVGKSSSDRLSYAEAGVKSTTFSIPVVVGYELTNGITFEYRGAFDLTKSVDYNGLSGKLENTSVTGMITIGYKFKM